MGLQRTQSTQMLPLREQAEYLRICLAMGLIDELEITAWADRMIAALVDPPIEIIDLSVAGKRPNREWADMLAHVPGPGDLVAAAHRSLGRLREMLVRDEVSVEFAIKALQAYCQWSQASEKEGSRAYWLNESLFLFREQQWGSREDLRAQVLQFLNEFAALPSDQA